MKQLEVQIMGQNYVLGCPENSEARLLKAVNRVDSSMCKIRDTGKVKARDRIAVLVALNLSFELFAPPPAAAVVTDSGDTAAVEKLESEQPQLTALLARLDAALATSSIPQK